jgi:hypothetical protein
MAERAARAQARLGDPLGGERLNESFEVTWRGRSNNGSS